MPQKGEPPFCAVHWAVRMCLDYEVLTVPETVTETVRLRSMIVLTQTPRTPLVDSSTAQSWSRHWHAYVPKYEKKSNS